MLVYLIFVMVSLLIGLCIKKKCFGVYIFILAIGLAFLAFNMDVHPKSDLVNHYNRMELFRSNEITIQDMLKKLNAGTHLLFWLLSFFPINAYLQAFSVFVCYMLMFRLAYNVCKDNDAPKAVYLLCIMMILLSYNFYVMANSIRMWLVFSAFFYLLYNEIIRKKKKLLVWIGYIALVLFHYGALFLLVGRMVAIAYSSVKKMTLPKWIILVICGIGGIVFLCSSYFSTYVVAKIQDYSVYATRGTWQTIIGFVRISTVCILIKKTFKKVDENYREFFVVLLFVCAIPVLLFTNYVLILRFGDAVIAASSIAIVLSNKVSGYPRISMSRMSLSNFLIMVCMFICFVAFAVFDYRYLIFNFM